MNIIVDIFNFIVEVLNLTTKAWAWCPIKVDNRNDRF